MRKPADCRILVMDDEPALAKLMGLFLSRSGYQVETCTDGREAWSRYEACPTGYNLVIADLNMPDIEVPPLLPRFAQLNPAVRVLVCSGEIFDPQTLPRPVQPNFSVLQKPFVPNMLTGAVTDALNRPLARSAVA